MQYDNPLQAIFQTELGYGVQLKCSVDDTMNSDISGMTKERIAGDGASARDIPSVPVPAGIHNFSAEDYEFTFDSFIVGPSNHFAYASCTAVAKNPGGSYNPLFLYGPSGLGKTHLMCAIAHEISRTNPKMNIGYATSEEFGNDFIRAIESGSLESFHQKYRSVDVLLIDDVQFFPQNERIPEEFFHTFNALQSEKKQIVITSDRPPKELHTLENRIRTRFESGLITDIYPPELETRIAIIQRKSEATDLKLSNDVTEYIASNLKSNVRQLEDAVKKLKAHQTRTHTSPTLFSLTTSFIRFCRKKSPNPSPSTPFSIASPVCFR